MWSCPFCQSDNCRLVMEARGHPILRCPSCELVFTGVKSDFSSSEIYTEEFWQADSDGIGYRDYFREQEKSRRKWERHLKKISSHTGKQAGRILDFGCGPGFFLKAARERGWETFGVDISRFAVDYAKKDLGLENIHCGPLPPDEWKRQGFDVITLWAAIEHLPDPWKVLKSLCSFLKPGGLVCMTTGNMESIAARREGENWRLMTPPGHLFFFTRKTMKTLLEHCGLRMTKYRTNDYFGKNPPSLFRIKPVKKTLRLLGRGDIMTVFARKS